jgi:hypothetical protein
METCTPSYDDLVRSVKVLAELVYEDYPNDMSLHEIAHTWTLRRGEDLDALRRVEHSYVSVNSASAASTNCSK